MPTSSAPRRILGAARSTACPHEKSHATEFKWQTEPGQKNEELKAKPRASGTEEAIYFAYVFALRNIFILYC